MSRRAFRWSSERTIDEPIVNLTPLIDIVFSILITFIVVAPLLELDRIELADASSDLPEKMHSVQENSPIAVYVREDNALVVDGKVLNMTQLADYLKEAKKKYPQARPQLFHDKKAHFGTYQAVKNSVEAAGFEEMDIILKPA